MERTYEANESAASRRSNALLHSIMLSLFVSGIVAVGVLWALESRFGLLDELCRVAYPTILVIFFAGAVMLHRRPQTIVIARWMAFLSVIGLLVIQFAAAVWGDGPLVGNYPFISLLMWLPLAYAIAMLMLETRHGPWAACALFVFIAMVSIFRIFAAGSGDAGDTALLVNLLASHIVLLACLSGLVKFKLALAKADARSNHLFEQASTDPLTGLANRRYGLEMLRRAVAEPVSEVSSAIIVCDIDRFKGINDLNGHDVGDRVLLTVAAILKKSTRDLDTVIRWGGDEFLIVVPRIGAPALAELAERLRARVAAATLRDDGQCAIALSLSIGVAALVDDEKIDDWIKRADQALYLAKAAGRNRCVFAPGADVTVLSSVGESTAVPIPD